MFCRLCGIGDAQESICDNCVAEKDVNEVIKHYFHRGYPYVCSNTEETSETSRFKKKEG